MLSSILLLALLFTVKQALKSLTEFFQFHKYLPIAYGIYCIPL